MTAPCLCKGCILGQLQITAMVLARGQAAMAADALETLIENLKIAVASPSPEGKPRREAGKSTKARQPRNRERLSALVTERPELCAVVAEILRISIDDVGPILRGRATLASSAWKRVFAAIEAEGQS